MPTTHTWRGASTKYIYDPAQYTDGTPFAPGDTLVVGSGSPFDGPESDGTVRTLIAGTYQFNVPGSSTGLYTNNNLLDAAGTIAVTGAGTLAWLMLAQFVSKGAIQVGSAAASGNVRVNMVASAPATLTNQGSITVQNDSLFRLDPIVADGTFVNAAGGMVSIGSGSALALNSSLGYNPGGPGNLNTTNNGVIEVTAAAGRSARAKFSGSYGGSGLLSVRGTPGASSEDASATIYGPASGIFDMTSGQLDFFTAPVGGSINFLDNNAALIVERGLDAYPRPGLPFGATILGFQAGDSIKLTGYANFSSFTYDPGSHLLTILGTSGGQSAQFKFAGSYAQSDFQVTPLGFGGYEGLEITTTSTSQAVPSFSYTDSVTGAAGTSGGQQYAGPLTTLQSQYIWAKPDGASLAAYVPNVFLQGGAGNDALTGSAGSNVLDGGLGSNFVTGGTGADGGTDTFFLDGTVGTTWDTIANFHPGDSVTLWGFAPGTSTLAWAANEGAAGHTGATIHSAFAGAGTAVNGSLTFAGLSLADAQSKITLTPGSVGGRSYLYAHYNG